MEVVYRGDSTSAAERTIRVNFVHLVRVPGFFALPFSRGAPTWRLSHVVNLTSRG